MTIHQIIALACLSALWLFAGLVCVHCVTEDIEEQNPLLIMAGMVFGPILALIWLANKAARSIAKELKP